MKSRFPQQKLASEDTSNPDPTIMCEWGGVPAYALPELKAMAQKFVIIPGTAIPDWDEIGPSALDASGKIGFQLPVNTTLGGDPWDFYIAEPRVISPPEMGRVILISEDQWDRSRTILTGGTVLTSWLGLDYWAGSTLLQYFCGYPTWVSDHDGRHYAWDTLTWKTITKGDQWYDWLTHKVGVTWSGTSASVPVYQWVSSSGFSEQMRVSPEWSSVYDEALAAAFSTLKGLPAGGSATVAVNSEITWEDPSEGGSSKDLFLAVARARISGNIYIIAGAPHSDPDRVNIQTLSADLTVMDLYDFNYLNNPLTSGNAATLQAGWKKFSNSSGGPGQVFFTEFNVTDVLGAFEYEND